MKVSLLLFSILQSAVFSIQEDASYVVISLTKTQCFGQCPAFEFELYSDQTASFNGIAFTDREGSWTTKLNKKEFDGILSEFEKSDFFEFKDRYYAEFTDLPTTYVYFSDGESEKKIMDYYGAPQKLKDLESKVDSLIESLTWKHITN